MEYSTLKEMYSAKEAFQGGAAVGVAEASPGDAWASGRAGFTLPTASELILHFHEYSAVPDEDGYEVRLLVTPEYAPLFRRNGYHPTQQIEEERPEGWTVVSFEVESLEEVHAFVRAWGLGVVVMEPAVLARRVKRDAEALLRHYRHVRTG